MRKARILAALFSAALSGPAQAQVSPGPAATPYLQMPREYYLYQSVEYVATTNSMSMPAGDTTNITVCNTYPVGGKSLYVFKRRFDNNTAYNGGALSYGGLSGAGNISDSSTYSSATAATTTAGNSLTAGAASSSGMTMTSAVGTARLSGTVNGAGYLPTDAASYKLEEYRVIPPQKCFAQFITNPPAALGGATDNVSFTFYWWEQ